MALVCDYCFQRKNFWNRVVSHLGKWITMLLSRIERSVANRGNNSASAPEDLRCYLSFARAAGQIFCKGTLSFFWRRVLKIKVTLFIQSWQPSSKLFLSIFILNYTVANLGAPSQISTDLCKQILLSHHT